MVYVILSVTLLRNSQGKSGLAFGKVQAKYLTKNAFRALSFNWNPSHCIYKNKSVILYLQSNRIDTKVKMYLFIFYLLVYLNRLIKIKKNSKWYLKVYTSYNNI